MAPNTESKERLEKEADHSTLVNGRFNTQGNFYMRLVFSGGKTHRSHQQAKILKVSIEALTELAESVRMPQQQLSLSTPENSLGWGNVAGEGGAGEGGQNLNSQGSSGPEEPPIVWVQFAG